MPNVDTTVFLQMSVVLDRYDSASFIVREILADFNHVNPESKDFKKAISKLHNIIKLGFKLKDVCVEVESL